MMQKIVFIGGTGMLGQPVARELIKTGHTVTFLARNPAKLQQLYPGEKITQGDVFNRASLKTAFTGQDIVYLNLSVAQTSTNNQPQPEREGLSNVIAIARETGIRKIAYLSSLVKNYQGMNGFNWWSFDIKQKAVELIRSSGLAYTIFYPSTFMESLDKQMLQGNKLMMAKGSEAKMWFIAAEDYAKQVVSSFRIPGHTEQEYVIQGQTGYDWKEAAAIFKNNYGKKISVLFMPLGVLKFFGHFSRKMNYAAHICEALNKYPERFESEMTWKELGIPQVTLEEYTKKL